MKPANFPERKNRRRKRALARLETIKQPKNTHAWRQEHAALSARIVDSARDVRTKKYRGRSDDPRR